MAKRLISIRISDATKERLNELANRHGTQTEAVAIAIDRLYEQMIADGQLEVQPMKQWICISDRYSRAEIPMTPEQLYEMCDELGWERPVLERRGDEYRTPDGETILRYVEPVAVNPKH